MLFLSINSVSLRAQTPSTEARQLLNKGVNLLRKGQYNESNTYLIQAAKLFSAHEKPIMVAHCYNHLGSNNRIMSNFELARYQSQKALSFLEGLKLDDPTERIKAFTNLGLIAAVHVKYNLSLKLLEKASKLLNDDAVSAVMKMLVISSLGSLYDDRGKYDKALFYYNKALSALLVESDPPKRRLAKIYNNIGVAYTNKGLYKQARHYHRLELKANLAVKERNYHDVAISYLNLGNSYFYSGDVGEALIYLKKARRLIEKINGYRNVTMLMILNNTAACQIKLHKFKQGINLLKKAITIKIQLFGVDRPELAVNYTNIATAFDRIGRDQQAYKYYRKALAVRKRSLRKNHPNLAITHNILGQFLLDHQKISKAISHLKKAKEIILASIGSRHPTLSETYTAMGRAYAAKGKVVQSISYFQKALSIIAPTFNGVKAKENPNVAQAVYPVKALSVLKYKAKSLRILFNKTKNLSLLKASLYTYMALSKYIDRQQWGYNQLNSKIAIAKQSYSIYEDAIEASYKLYKVTDNDSFLHLIFYFSEKSKGRILLETVAHPNDKQIAGVPVEMINHEQKLKYAITTLKQVLNESNNSDSGTKNSSGELKDSLFTLNRKLAAFTRNIEKEYPKYYRLKYYNEFPEVFKIQQQLKKNNRTIVEYFLGQYSLYAIIITGDNLWVQPLEFNKNLSKKVTAFRKAIISNDKNYFKLGHTLYSALIKPVEPYLKQVSSLLIVPAKQLRLLPFGALLSEKVTNKRQIKYEDLPYFIKDYNISYLTSVSLNVAIEKSSHTEYDKQFIGFAPFFKPKSNKQSPKETVRTGIWAPLMFTDYEIKIIASKFKDSDSFWDILPWVDTKNTELFLQSKATENNFKNNGSLNARFIHLATHAFADNELDNKTGIVFYQNPNNHNDDILYLNEIYNLQMNAQLVVLSACETGLGTIIPGEGLMGLSRAFQYAGANNLVVSLWKVNDRLTAELMIQFYAYLNKQYSISKALSAAKRAVINNRRFANPRYWAPFKLIGSGK